MNKIGIVSALLVALLTLGIVSSVFAAQPPVDPSTYYVGQTSVSRIRADPKRAYDTFSGDIIMNAYDTLIFTDPESHSTFHGTLASAYGKDVAGVYGGTPTEPVWWFTVNTTGKVFQTWTDKDGNEHVADPLTMEDVEYSFKLGLVEDLSGAPMWMLWLPLFESMNMAPFYGTTTDLKNFADELNTNTIWVSGNTIFFKMAFPFPDVAWLQIMSQPWGAVMNKEWAIDRGCWDGEWIKTVTGGTVGTGTGSQTMFQILYDMPLGGTDKGVSIIDGTETIYLDGVPTTDYTMSSKNGTIYFNTAPGAGVVITIDCDYDHFFMWRRWPGGASSYSPIDTKLPDYPQAQYDDHRMCGTGPYIMTKIDFTNFYCQLDKFDAYYGGWTPGHTQPNTLDRIILNWVDGSTAAWPTRLSKFLTGDYDRIYVPRDSMFDLFKEGWDINNPNTWLPIDGIYGIKNIAPVLSLDAIHFVCNFDGVASTYDGDGEIGAGHGIPINFFNDYRVRRAFAYMFNFTQFLKDSFYAEAEQPITWSIKGLAPDYTDPTITKYSKNLMAAKADLQSVMFTKGATTQSAWDWGFKFTIAYNSGNKPRQIMCNIIQDALTELSSIYGMAGHFSADVVEIDWGLYLEMFELYEMPIFTIGWLADFSDPDNFVRPYMHSEGDFAYFQNYNNPYVDQLLDWGIHNATYLPDSSPNPERRWCYQELQRIYHDEVPSVPMNQPFGRYFGRTWVKGWCYNAIRPPNTFYRTMGKQDGEIDLMGAGGSIDTSQDQVNTVCDLNFDNKVDMKDIGIVIRAFGSVPGGAKWNFLADVAQNMGDRKVDMKDIGWVVSKFGWAA